jgi:hypothetical protein
MKTLLKTDDGRLVSPQLTDEEYIKRYTLSPEVAKFVDLIPQGRRTKNRLSDSSDVDVQFEQAKFLVSQGIVNSLSHGKMIVALGGFEKVQKK